MGSLTPARNVVQWTAGTVHVKVLTIDGHKKVRRCVLSIYIFFIIDLHIFVQYSVTK